jgi:ribosome biogenesis GTPase A
MDYANKILDYLKVDKAIPVIRHGNKINEISYTNKIQTLKDRINNYQKEYKSIAIICKTSQEVDELNQELSKHIRINKIDENILKNRYRIDFDLNDEPINILEKICVSRGFLLRGGELDYDRGAAALINDFKANRLGAISLESPDDIKRLTVKDRKPNE